MGFEISLKLLAGISALALGAGVFLRGPVRWRNRSFALLSLALAVWHLGHLGYLLTGHRGVWQPIFMAGSLGAAPLGLDFALTLCGRFWRDRRRLVLPVGFAALAVWVFVAATSVWSGRWISLSFIAVTLTVALGLILHQSLALSAGPARRALLGVFLGGVLAAIGGVSDLIPREGRDIPDLGAPATLLFLAIVCAVILRHHLLDIDGFVLRTVGILTFSTVAAVLLWVVYGWIGDRGFLPFAIAGTLVIVPLILLAPGLRRRARSLFRTDDPLIHQFSEISAALPRLTTRRQVHELFRTASETLPPPIRMQLLEIDPVLATLLDEERFLTLRFLEDALADARDERRERLRNALERMRGRSWDLVFGMSGEHGLIGSLAVGGPLPERYLTEALAAAGTALANQVASCLERIDTIEAAERDKSMVAIGSVAASLAHEIRNPLAALRGAGQAMGEESTPEQRVRMLRVIQEESARLESFVQDFLEFAIPKSLRRTTVDLERLSRDAIRARQAGGDPFTVEWDAEPGVPAVSGDAELLRRAFDNLARNALEAGGEGITITVTLRRAANGTVEWSVADDGPGISEGGIDRMTEPHFTTKAAGTGLGLAMVRRVIEQHGGRLVIANRSGWGAVHDDASGRAGMNEDRPHILIVDDEPNMRLVLSTLFEQNDFVATSAHSAEEALAHVRDHDPDLVLTDMQMPGMGGLELLETLTDRFPEIPVVLLTAYGTVSAAVTAMRRGAFDFLLKPFDHDQLVAVARKAVARARGNRLDVRESRESGTGQLLGESEPMVQLRRTIEKVAHSPATVLIRGETGTGKELVANAIHASSSRSDQPLIAVNCGALPETLVESELFGYMKGAFTGATDDRIGRFKLADGGTLFLDEIGELPLASQVKLTRALQDGEIMPVGGTQTEQVDVRLIAATHRDLERAVHEGAFRQDLYFRLKVVQLAVPPLRDRIEDIPALVERFIDKQSARLDRPRFGVAPEALEALMSRPWPGNVRELENAVERAVLLAEDDPLTSFDFGLADAAPKTRSGGSMQRASRSAAAAVERRMIRAALDLTGGNVTHAAERLGLSRRGLQNKMKELGLRDSRE